MTLDLFLAGAVLVFALLGAITGAARQIASIVASVVAYLAARPVGNLLGPKLAEALNGPQLFGVVAGTLVAFIVVMLVVRALLGGLLRRILAGRDGEHAGIDRLLGFVFGGAKVAAIGYVVLSALAFAQDNISVAGKRLGISPKDSYAFQFAREHNLLTRAQFAPVQDLVKLAEALQDPFRAQQLKHDPAFKKLLEDPKFRAALSTAQSSDASAEKGDYSQLLRSNAILQLVQDPTAAARMAAAAESVEGIPGGETAAGAETPAPPATPGRPASKGRPPSKGR